MATTRTASAVSATPRASIPGPVVAAATWTANGSTVSASEVILAIKIPNGATIFDGYVSGTYGAAASVWKIGTSADDDLGGAVFSLSATAQLTRFNGGSLPFKVSLSDDAEPKWTWLKLEQVSGTATATASIQVVVQYSMPGNI